MIKAQLAIVCSMTLILSSLVYAQAEDKTPMQKPIIIEDSSAVQSVPLKPTTPISAATPLKAVVNKPAMNIKTVLREEIINAKKPWKAIITKFHHLLPTPVGAISNKPILDVLVITENSNAENEPLIKKVSNQIFSAMPVIIDASYSMMNTPIDAEVERQRRNPPLIQRRYPTEFFPDTIYVLNVPTKELKEYHTPVSCLAVSCHHHWCQRYPGECEKNLEKRKKAHEIWCKKHPAKCQNQALSAI